ncbi:MAG: hypothetical protein EOT05_00330 [Candidatus Microsaccharimonas sossegonensis]|uniref:Signal peptidase I n=1 Tax=Candidatus Microsaccharimonas sossegonensis TaxID=2506948 RepID=A0A4Q0AGC7_9BACT|nr:MAG: hypothetical protein EOT05_00330 [Candidatus Microsaccharimonas sossegonensis]
MNNLLQLAQSSYDYTYTTTSSNTDPSIAAALSVGILLFYFITIAITYVVTSIFLGMIFKKAGVPAWVAWVPFYNTWKLLEIGGQQGFWAILAVIPFVNLVSAVFTFIAMYNIGLKFGKSGAFVVLGIFLPIVWLIWLAVDTSKWNNSLGEPSRAVEHNPNATPPAATPPV